MCRFYSQINNKMDKDYFGNVWIKSDKDVREYPIGTKFKALMGGYWIRTERGFKWCTGSTFPNVGGDWTGEVCLPLDIVLNEVEKLLPQDNFCKVCNLPTDGEKCYSKRCPV